MILVRWRSGSAFRYAFFSKIIATCLCFFIVSTLSHANSPALFLYEISAACLCNYQMLFTKLKLFGLGPHRNPYMPLQIQSLIALNTPLST